jgi:hypothetical protein
MLGLLGVKIPMSLKLRASARKVKYSRERPIPGV